MTDDLKIPYPQKIPLGKGIHSTGTKEAARVRTTVDEQRRIEQASLLVDMKASSFMRWASVHLADAILKQHNE